ncbi:hypothetical protein [Streptomyces bacillaris]|uniref:hypothetical protein n=1 Tax=Streptomyces bacillaris TaxID=68179 RepID=UPI0037F101B4
MSDRMDRLIEGFREAVTHLPELTEELPDDVDAYDVGYEAGRAALAPIAWARAVGDRIQTAELTEMLDLSRQALQKRVRSHTLIGLPGKRTTHYPRWQFDFARGEILPATERVLRIFRATGEFDPYMIAAWMNEPCTELGEERPADLLEDEGRVGKVFEQARTVAKRWAQ